MRGITAAFITIAVLLPAAAQAKDEGRGGVAVTAVRTAAATASQRVPAMTPPEAPALPYRRLSVPGMEEVDVGLGLFSVVGATEKELMRRRTDPSRDTAPGRSRLAGAGFRLSF